MFICLSVESVSSPPTRFNVLSSGTSMMHLLFEAKGEKHIYF